MLKIFPTISICLFVILASIQSLNAQAQQNGEEPMCKITLEESGKKKVLMVPRSEIAEYVENPNLVGINCRNEADRK